MRLAGLEQAGDTEVDEPELIGRLTASRPRHHDVTGLQVAEDDGRNVVMQVIEHATQLLGDAEDLCDGEPRPAGVLEIVLQGLALDEVHDQIPASAGREVVMNARQPRVMELGEQERLALEGFGGLGKLRWSQATLAQLFERDGAVTKLGVSGLVDRAHAAGTRETKGAIAPDEQSPWRQVVCHTAYSTHPLTESVGV